jgi:hypothetical protein
LDYLPAAGIIKDLRINVGPFLLMTYGNMYGNVTEKRKNRTYRYRYGEQVNYEYPGDHR